MRQTIFLILVGLAAAAASCGDAGDDAPDAQEPVYTVCAQRDYTITTMAAMDELGATGCEELYTITVIGEGITSLEPLRSLRRVGYINMYDTKVVTLEPLRDLEDVLMSVNFADNAKLSYCEITGWIALVKSRDPNGNFGSMVDNPKQNSPCSTVNYP